MKFACRFLVTFACMAIALPVYAEDSNTILDRFTGTWTATGNSFGSEVPSKMVWSKTLRGQFYKIDYQINAKNSFVGVGYYKVTKGPATSGYWADNSGDLHPLTARVEADRLTTIWGKAGVKLGRTEYRLVDANHAVVTDWLLTSEGWRQFNTANFRREIPSDKN